MNNESIILILVGGLQALFMVILAHVFKTMSELRVLITENTREDKENKEKLESKITTLLDTHYVTTGMLTTLEEKLFGEIKGLSSAINALTDILKNKI